MTFRTAPMTDTTRRMARRLATPVFGSSAYNLSLMSRVPTALRVVPPALWRGDPERGVGILKGRFDIGTGRTVTSIDPWATADSTSAFKASMHGFGWLRDVATVPDQAVARTRIRTILGDWLARNIRWSPIAWRADVLGERAVSWLTYYDTLIATAGETFRRDTLRSLTRQLVHLNRVSDWESDGAARVTALKGLVYGAVCFPEGSINLRGSLKRLEAEIERQILPDGGHLERNPSIQHRVLRDLVDVRATLLAGNHDIPPFLQNAIDRMAPLLRFFRHGDGGLALFNGSREESAAEIDLTLAKADARGQPPRNAPYLNFERLNAGRLLVVADAGAPPSPGVDLSAHAGALSFELSVGRERLIVNCGATSAENEAWKRAQRTTAAHSTLSIENVNSSEVLPSAGIGRRPRKITCDRNDDESGSALRMSHDGYLPSFGATHHRQLWLSAVAERLDGKDVIEATTELGFTIRFHLHPNVSATLTKSGTTALLRLPRSGGWRLSVSGGVLRLEESIYLGNLGGPRRSQQIVVDGRTAADGSSVSWSVYPER